MRGNMLIAQSGGPTAVMNASLVAAIQEALSLPAHIGNIYGARNGIEGVIEEELIDLRREKPATLEVLGRTPSAALGTCRHRVQEGEYERILEVLAAHRIRYFFYIGGNDSMDTCHRLGLLASERGYDLRVMGIPKTIDNDLPRTDHCPGYGSVARFVACAVRDAGSDTRAMRRIYPVKVLEVMGRNCGWIAAAASLGREREADAPHLIYFPERPLAVERVLQDVAEVHRQLGYVVIAVCEGAKGEDGQPLAAHSETPYDSFGHMWMGRVADYLCQQVEGRLGLKARFDKPGTLQRVSSLAVSDVDLEEAALVGQMAVRKAAEGASDMMVTLVREEGDSYRSTTGLAPLAEVANVERRLPEEFVSREENFVTAAFIQYARPLIGGPLPSLGELHGFPVAKLATPFNMKGAGSHAGS